MCNHQGRAPLARSDRGFVKVGSEYVCKPINSIPYKTLLQMIFSRVSSRALGPKHILPLRKAGTMATAHKVLIDAQNVGVWGRVKQTDEAAAKVTELLQEDLEVNIYLRLGLNSIRLTTVLEASCFLQRQRFPQPCK